jgi:hypothetical protein
VEVVRHHPGEHREVGLVPPDLGDVVEDRDRPALPGARVQRPPVDADQDALRPGRVAHHHLDGVGPLAPQRPHQRQLVLRERGAPVRPEQPVVLLPPVRVFGVVVDPEQLPGRRVVQQELAVLVDHADAVADAGHHRAEQPGLTAALPLGRAQPGGGRADLGDRPFPPGGQHIDQPGEDHRDRQAAAEHRAGQPAVRARQVAGVGPYRQGPLAVGDVQQRLPLEVGPAAGGVVRDDRLGSVGVVRAQVAVELPLADGGQHAAEEVLAAHAEHEPAAEGGVGVARPDRRGEDERVLLLRRGQVPVAQQDVRVGDGRHAHPAGVDQRVGRLGRARQVETVGRAGLGQPSGEDGEVVLLATGGGAQHEAVRAALAPQPLHGRDLRVGGRHDERDTGRADQRGGRQRRGGRVEVLPADRLVGGEPGGGGGEQRAVALGLGQGGGLGHLGPLVHHPLGVLALVGPDAGDDRDGGGEPGDQDDPGEPGPGQPAAAGARRGGSAPPSPHQTHQCERNTQIAPIGAIGRRGREEPATSRCRTGTGCTTPSGW